MSLALYHDAECQRPVSDADPFISKHTNAGEAVTTVLYIGNDGKRKGVSSDVAGEIALIYTNLKVQLEGLQVQLEIALSPSISTKSKRGSAAKSRSICVAVTVIVSF